MTSLLTRDDSVDVQSEIERLARLRHNVAQGLMALSESARRDADALLAAGTDDGGTDRPFGKDGDERAHAGFSAWGLLGAFTIGLACGLAVMWAAFSPGNVSRPTARVEPVAEEAEPPALESDAALTAVPPSSALDTEPPPLSAPSSTTIPVADERLVVDLTVSRPCWIRVQTDGGEMVERTLTPSDAIVLEADYEVALRVGDAGAVSLTVNGKPARPLGGAGQAVSARITTSNVATFLSD